MTIKQEVQDQIDQVYYANYLSNKMVRILSELSPKIRDAIYKAINGTVTDTKLKALLSKLQEEANENTIVITNELKNELEAFAKEQSAYIVALAALAIKPPITRTQLFEELLFGGNNINFYLKKFNYDNQLRINSVIRQGIVDGLTANEIVDKIIGTKKLNYKDGVLETSRRGLTTLVNTAITSIESEIDYQVYSANGYEYVQFVAIMDEKTSDICRSLNGKVWQVGDPRIRKPALHPNCRSKLKYFRKRNEIEGLPTYKELFDEDTFKNDRAKRLTLAELFD